MMRTTFPTGGAPLRRWLAVSAILLVLGATAACGTKSRPELPEGQTDRYPRQYPNPNEP